MKEILDIKQLSTYLQVSISEIRKLVRQKNIPYFRIGNRLKFDLANINLWIEELEEKTKKYYYFRDKIAYLWYNSRRWLSNKFQIWKWGIYYEF